MRTLLCSSVDANYRDLRFYGVPLMGAAWSGHTDVARTLCKYMADVNTVSLTKRRTSLIIAAMLANIDMVEFLVEEKARVDIVDGLGYTAVSMAIAHGKKDIAKYLLSIGAPLGEAALRVAVNSESSDMVRLVLEHEPSRRNDRDQMQEARTLAVELDLSDIVDILDASES